MTYYNPKIYNYSNLNKRDQEKLNDMIFWLMNEVERKCEELDSISNDKKESLQERLKAEAQLEAVQNLFDDLKIQLIEYIVNAIDNDEREDIESIDTMDYLYGCPEIEVAEKELKENE